MIKRMLVLSAMLFLILAMVVMQIDIIPIVIMGFAFSVSLALLVGVFCILTMVLAFGLLTC